MSLPIGWNRINTILEKKTLPSLSPQVLIRGEAGQRYSSLIFSTDLLFKYSLIRRLLTWELECRSRGTDVNFALFVIA